MGKTLPPVLHMVGVQSFSVRRSEEEEEGAKPHEKEEGKGRKEDWGWDLKGGKGRNSTKKDKKEQSCKIKTL